VGLGTHLFVKIPRPGVSEGPFRSSSQAEILSAFPKGTTSELADLSSCYPFLMLNVNLGCATGILKM